MAQKAVFVDRDDTIVDDRGLITDPDHLRLLPEASKALAQFKR
jgi:histidinol phosphatase-like enzyme